MIPALVFWVAVSSCEQACGPSPLSDSEVTRLLETKRAAMNQLAQCVLREPGKKFTSDSARMPSEGCGPYLQEAGAKTAYSTDAGAVFISVYSYGMAGTGIYQWIVRAPGTLQSADGGWPPGCRDLDREWCVLLTGR